MERLDYLVDTRQPMRNLYLIRHAKSGWDNPSLADHDRPLNERGRRDAPAMAARLRQKGYPIDLLLTSTATRADHTAMAFAHAYEIPPADILRTRELYHAEVPDFLRVISRIEDRFLHVAIFSHNPGITDFAAWMQVASIDHMPTCAVFGLTTQAASWKDFPQARRRFYGFESPKTTLTGP